MSQGIYRALRVGFVAVILAVPVAALAGTVDAARYSRAAQFLQDNREALLPNATIEPHWRNGPRERFTYRRELGEGRAEFVAVDAATGKRHPAFDAAVIASGLGSAIGKVVEGQRLPFKDYEELDDGSIRFDAEQKTWICSTSIPRCSEREQTADPMAVASPDGKWLAFVEDNNLWIRSPDGTTRFALTTDGGVHNAYCAMLESTRGESTTGGKARPPGDPNGVPVDGPPSRPPPPQVLWSPDSRHLFTYRLDERAVRSIVLVQSNPMDGTLRPAANTWRYAMPNDAAVATAELWLFDVTARQGYRVGIDPLPIVLFTPIGAREAWWSDDGSHVYLISRTRYFKTMRLHIIDSASGAARELISETGKTFVEPAAVGERPMTFVLANGDVAWFSERDGYGHFYLYDAVTGRLKRRLTSGAWTVRNVLRVDEPLGYLYVAGNERVPDMDPYNRIIYRIRLSDGQLKRLTPEDADHSVIALQDSAEDGLPREALGFSPSGRYFLDTYSRADSPAVTVLRRADGQLITEVERADVTRLKALGLVTPERFSALAADGHTRLYGNLLRPSDFDPNERYPILDSPYPGPQHGRARPNFASTVFDHNAAQAYAELGFIVVLVDGRGSYGRSKAFHDESYGGLGQAGHLDDHVAVIRELARRYPYVDLDRVGIYGTSGGGYATVHAMLKFPDFFKVGVADAGNHDQRSYLAAWGETYNGPETGSNYTDAANALLAANLNGKLLLLHGDLDTNVLPHQTYQLVDALIKSNKDFDLLIVPNDGHGTLLSRSYALRRAWDFLVRNLMGAEPPAQYALQQ